jgi:dTMP kinase
VATVKNRGFITFEGGEGSGKTTLIARLHNWLIEQQKVVVCTREPGSTELAEALRSILLNGSLAISSRSELFLLLAARSDHLDKIIVPALEEGKIVLCDRFHDSTVAYQGGGRGLPIDSVEECCFFSSKRLEPSLTILLDIAPEEGLSRAVKRSHLDKMELESLEFHRKIRSAFLLQAKRFPARIHVIDAMQSQDVVFDAAKSLIEAHLNSTQRRKGAESS